jgi:hypothetical protein
MARIDLYESLSDLAHRHGVAAIIRALCDACDSAGGAGDGPGSQHLTEAAACLQTAAVELKLAEEGAAWPPPEYAFEVIADGFLDGEAVDALSGLTSLAPLAEGRCGVGAEGDL